MTIYINFVAELMLSMKIRTSLLEIQNIQNNWRKEQYELFQK